MNRPKSAIKSPDTLTIARELSDQQIAIIKSNEDMGGAVIADRLEKLRNVVWYDAANDDANWQKKINKKPRNQEVSTEADEQAKEKKKRDVFKDVIDGLDATQKEQLVSSYARMGHLYDIAALSARSNYIKDLKKNGEAPPGGVEATILENSKTDHAESIGSLIEKLNHPVFEVVMTAHPTNVNSIESMAAQREIDKAMEDGDATKLKAAIKEYQKTPLLHQADGRDANLTVHDETKTALYFLSNIYEDLPKAYQNYDDALGKYAKTKDSNYDKTALNLKTKLGSWGSSGDKDGNSNVTAETTLEAIAMHTQAIVEHYSKDLGDIKSSDSSPSSDSSQMKDGFNKAVAENNKEVAKKWKKTFDTALTELNPLLKEIENLRKNARKSSLPPEELSEQFDKLSEKLAKVRKGLNGKDFETDLKSIANNDDKALNLLRRFRTFGFNFAKIEYRETAKEYGRVVGELIDGYKDLTPEDKVVELTKLLQEGDNAAAKLFEKKGPDIITEGAGKEYDHKGRLDIQINKICKHINSSAFTSTQREEALSSINHVLDSKLTNINDNDLNSAILKKYGDSSESLNNLLKKIEKLAPNDGGLPKGNPLAKYKIPSSPKPIAYHTLKRMALARDFGDMIKDNVLAECGQLKDGASEKSTIAQGVANMLEASFLQRAVEKNGKRAVLGVVPLFEEPATMMHIDKIVGAAYENKAYQKQMEAVRKANEENSPTQQVMIAHSDNARRSGLQAARAYIHEAHQKIRALNAQRETDGKEAIKTQFFEGGSISDAYRNGVRAISASVNAFGLHDFAKFTFQGGDLLNYFNHPDSTARLFDRQISQQAKALCINGKGMISNTSENVDAVAIKALKETLSDYQTNDFITERMGALLTALNYKKTIQDSNAGSRAGARGMAVINPTTTLGTIATAVKRFANNAVDAVEKVVFEAIDIDVVRTIGFSKAWQGSGIVPSWIGSLELKNNLDAASGRELSPTDLNDIYKQSPTFRDAQDRSAFAIALTDMDTAKIIASRKLAANDGDTAEEKKLKKSGANYLDRVQSTYTSAANLAYSALKGKSLNTSNFTNHQIRDKMLDALPLLKDDIVNKTNYRDFLLYLQTDHPDLLEDAHMGRITQSAKDTVEHGRWLGASDPSHAQHKDKAANDGQYKLRA